MLTKIKKTTNWFALISLVFNATMFGVFAPETAKAAVFDANVSTFILVDPVTDTELYEITDGGYLNLADLSSSAKVNVKAEVGGTSSVGSVRFNLDSGASTRNENSAPYALFGDGPTAGNYYETQGISLGVHNLVATPYSGAGATGMMGAALSINFTVINNQEPTVPSLVSPTDGSYLNYSNPSLSWDSSVDADGDTLEYVMQVDGPNGFNESFSAASPYPHAALPYEGTYTWSVKAYDGYEYSDDSATWSFTIDTVKPVISNIYANPDKFSPNGDMIKDTTDIYYTVNEDAENVVRVRDLSTDKLLWESPKQDQTAGTYSVNWDGTVDRNVSALGYLNGDKVDDGSYMIAVQSTDLAGNVKRDRTTRVEVDTQGPAGTYESAIDATNPTNNNDPSVYGKYYGTTAPADVFAAPSDGSIVTDIVSIKVVFEKLNTEAFETNGAISTNVKYWKPGYVDDLGQYTTHDEDLYVCEGCPVDSTSLKFVKAQIIPIVTSEFLPDGTYSVYVQSFDAAGNVTVENIENAQVIDTTKPGEVKNLVVTGKSDTSVSLKWDAVTDAAGYKVYYGTSEGVWTGVKSVGNVTSYTVSGLNANTNYFFKVVAFDAAMNDAQPSNIVSDKTNETPVVLASSTGNVSGNNNPAQEGQILGDTDEKKEEGNTENKDEKKDENKNNGFSWWWIIILLIIAGGGYYYYTVNPTFFKKFGKGPNPPSGI